ncbi:MAG: signal peptidase II [Armatimonadetes bacterium]|nr:signal peptidase II [Armatimonadota bacterium]
MRTGFFYLTAILVIVSDQLTKWAVMSNLTPGPHPVLGSLITINPTQNDRSAFSLFSAHPWVFAAIACVAVVVLSVAFHKQQRRDLWVSAALALALGGAVGNGIDRGWLGYVRDFFDVRVIPVFNVADSAITAAVIVLAWRVVLRPPAPEPITDPAERRAEPDENAAPPAGSA